MTTDAIIKDILTWLHRFQDVIRLVLAVLLLIAFSFSAISLFVDVSSTGFDALTPQVVIGFVAAVISLSMISGLFDLAIIPVENRRTMYVLAGLLIIATAKNVLFTTTSKDSFQSLIQAFPALIVLVVGVAWYTLVTRTDY